MPRVTAPPASACSTTAASRSSCCKRAGLKRIAYVDIDAHHGDGVFYAFEDDAAVMFADLHEDGRYLYPGTGAAEETGRGAAARHQAQSAAAAGRGRCAYSQACGRKVIAHLEKFDPEFIILQCGADSLEGDPITHLRFTPPARTGAPRASWPQLAERCGHGRVLALGGGGYNRTNLAQAWNAVVENLL